MRVASLGHPEELIADDGEPEAEQYPADAVGADPSPKCCSPPPPTRIHSPSSRNDLTRHRSINAPAESVNTLYKTELIRRRDPWRHAEHVELETLAWVDWFNNRRLHSELGDIPPAEFETEHYARNRGRQQAPTPTRI